MNSTNQSSGPDCKGKYIVLQKLGVRAAFLFVNFFLIITALYQLKPASRSLFIEALGAERLPYVWIITALTMVVFITYYHRLVARHSRFKIVLGTCLAVSSLLVLFRFMINLPGPTVAVCFYVFVDILSVVLVEQFWSLADSIYTTREGKSWYGFVGTGGLVGGIAGGGISALLLQHTRLQTPDLLLTAAVTIGITFVLTWVMGHIGLYCEVEHVARIEAADKGGWRVLGQSRYLMLIAAVLLLAQLVSPLIDYQFLNMVEASYPEREARTAFISLFFSVMGLISVGINLVITPLIHRFFGTIVGLLIQPLMISLFSWIFLFQATLFFGSAAKISDRGLSYSINRASKELLYIPIDPVVIYRAKAWIDMFGYRLFKVSGSFLILLVTQWLPVSLGIAQLSWITVSMCVAWIAIIMVLRHEYHRVCETEA
ncbi:MAG: Npt1/Npt2 family nucleotide transporter [Desulfobacteraceae bacterium]|nr:Npt1/Npt2 family nucleotide transporter [Desulfobacteraceae bacterium]